MSDYDLLLRGVLIDPRASFPRLVLCDWLEENGQERRAKLIRKDIAGDIGVPSGSVLDAMLGFAAGPPLTFSPRRHVAGGPAPHAPTHLPTTRTTSMAGEPTNLTATAKRLVQHTETVGAVADPHRGSKWCLLAVIAAVAAGHLGQYPDGDGDGVTPDWVRRLLPPEADAVAKDRAKAAGFFDSVVEWVGTGDALETFALRLNRGTPFPWRYASKGSLRRLLTDHGVPTAESP